MMKTVLKIDGMACGMCEAHINDAIRREFAVEKVSSSRGKGETEIISREPLDGERLKKVIADTGYTLLDVKTEPYEKKGLSLFRH